MNINRLDYIDYGKAFAIFMIILVHVGFSDIGNYVPFCIPIFFITAGYTYIPGKRTLKENIIGRFKTLLVPFWGFMLFYILVELIRAPYVGYGDARLAIPALINTAYGSGYIPNNSGLFNGILDFMHYIDTTSVSVDLITPTNNPLWFLPVFFSSSIIFYWIIEKTKKKSWVNRLAIIFILLVFASLEVVVPQIKQLPYGFGRGFLGAAFMLTGFWMKEYALFDKRKKEHIPLVAVSLFLVFVSMIMGSNCRGLVVSYYGTHGILSVFLTFLGGVGDVYFVLYLCKLIELLPLPKIKATLSLIGRNTMVIYVWHMALKFILDILYLEIFRAPVSPDKFYMILLPSNAGWYMILEAVVIVFVCICRCGNRTKKPVFMASLMRKERYRHGEKN